MLTNEKKSLKEFITCVIKKDYAKANSALHDVVDLKIKKRIKTAISQLPEVDI